MKERGYQNVKFFKLRQQHTSLATKVDVEHIHEVGFLTDRNTHKQNNKFQSNNRNQTRDLRRGSQRSH